MDKEELYDVLDEMAIQMGVENLLYAIARAMSSDELESNLRFIDRMYELENF